MKAGGGYVHEQLQQNETHTFDAILEEMDQAGKFDVVERTAALLGQEFLHLLEIGR